MTKRILIAVAWGLAGIVVAVGLTAGAFALAGREISEPATPPLFSSSPTPSRDADRTGSTSPDARATPSPSIDDDGPGGGEDNSGPDSGSGSGDDSSGPGSGDDSGSGSDNSGPGSDDSGSGSDDRDDD
ncbi:MAG: hypothetical protein ACRDGW_13055 [Actinomycetota bacterium]